MGPHKTISLLKLQVHNYTIGPTNWDHNEVSVINSLRGDAITRIVYRRTDGRTDGQTDRRTTGYRISSTGLEITRRLGKGLIAICKIHVYACLKWKGTRYPKGVGIPLENLETLEISAKEVMSRLCKRV